MDLLIDNQELIRNKVLKVNSLSGSETMDVSVKRQFEGKIVRFRKKPESLQFNRYSKEQPAVFAVVIVVLLPEAPTADVRRKLTQVLTG